MQTRTNLYTVAQVLLGNSKSNHFQGCGVNTGVYKRACSWLILASLVFLSTLCSAGSDKQTLTGTVSDSMCGTQHMTGSPSECTRTCVGHGAKYLLVVGEKTYALNTSDKTLLAVLDQQAGKNVTVTGTVNGVGIDVSSAVAAK